ncbi:HAD-IA family hydrolase [Peptoniphilus sp. KCTC 25270]|uniref:HAD family hydrolase n=1 Tax=Peptoniphilus sp. KCTC 25270 TaxID=2897414 RepID=UPI001E35D183|nr:HAD-IA family hydrolase [Peptoniphilus sp. KCTC 25270]MCD1147655.1 HAD-IA family hydrolase [Peptoniphilus sp. KCTC 25270]
MKAVAFDFDGTLIDSMGMWRNLGKNYLLNRGIPYTKEVEKNITAMSLAMAVDFLKEYFSFEEPTQEIYNEMASILHRGYSKELLLKDGAVEILEQFNNTDLQMVLATATNEDFVSPALKRFDLGKYFQWIQTCDNCGIQKGDVRFYHLLSEKLGVPCKEIYFFDDAPYALKAAQEAGLYTIGVKDQSNANVWEEVKKYSTITIDALEDFTLGGEIL